MKCQKCGSELPEGYVYCENCGDEVQFVPVFEPEVEDSIKHTLTGIFHHNEDFRDEPEPNNKSDSNNSHKKNQAISVIKKRWICLAILLLVCCVILVFSIKMVSYGSYGYQMETAQGYIEEEAYEEAIPFLKRALELADDEQLYDTKKQLVRVNIKLGNIEEAKLLLYEMITAQPDNLNAYKKLVLILEKQGLYDEIHKLVINGSPQVQENFKVYISNPPVFSLKEGEYNEVIHLEIDAEGAGEIYYTVNGNEPTESDLLYQEPIVLTNGVYEIAAVYINVNGIASECVRSVYRIEAPALTAPIIKPKNGTYTVPVMIVAEEMEGCQIYYTQDGTTPDESSKVYTEPIPMPLGQSNFTFLAISEYGIISELTTKKYNLNIETLLSTQTAIDAIKIKLMTIGKLVDLEGHSMQSGGYYRYECASAVKAGSRIYYLIDEYYVNDTIENKPETKSAKAYAVDVKTGELFEAIRKDTGQYEFSMF